jgi:hypothetical protein
VRKETVGCMYPICRCYGEHTPYLCDQHECSWPICSCNVAAPERWGKCEALCGYCEQPEVCATTSACWRETKTEMSE